MILPINSRSSWFSYVLLSLFHCHISYRCNFAVKQGLSWECESHTVSWECESHTVSWEYESHTVSWECESHTVSWECASHTVSWECESHTVSWECESHTVSWECESHTEERTPLALTYRFVSVPHRYMLCAAFEFVSCLRPTSSICRTNISRDVKSICVTAVTCTNRHKE